MRPGNHFLTGGEGYARHRPTYPPELAAALADACGRAGHALDVGCGSGQLTVLLAERFARVTGTDPSADQLAHAVARANVTYAREPAERVGLPDGSVDLVVAAQAAHWFDLPAFYAEARRVARPGATLALVSYGVPRLGGDAAGPFERLYFGHALHRHWPPEREHVERGYASLDFPFEGRPFPALAIERRWSLGEFRDYVGTWSATRRAVAAGETGTVDDFFERVTGLWGEAGAERDVRFPIAVRLAYLRSGDEP